jgi:sugar phosphate isomerase/epimerase
MMESLDRRTFLGTLAGGLAGIGLLACGGSPGVPAVPGRRLGLQLYTVRSLMENDVASTLQAVADAGYDEVETAGLFGLPAPAFRVLMDRAGLVSPAGHVPIEALRREAATVFAAAETLGQRWVVVPWLGEGDRTVDGYRTVAADLNRFGARARERGLRMAYHNHDFEFEALPGGERGWDILVDGTDPDLVDIELDIYWASAAGQDPLAIFERHPGRFPLWHLKDMATRQGTPAQTSVGQGEIDFPRLFAHAGQAGLRHGFVEEDNPADPLASIRASHDYLRRLPASAPAS